MVHAGEFPLDDLVEMADILTLHVPLNDETHHLIGERELSADEADRLSRQHEPRAGRGRGGAGARARARAASPARRSTSSSASPRSRARCLRLDNVVLTPHIASATHEAREAMGMLCVKALREVLAAVTARLAESTDAAAIAQIYNEGIEDRLATFETEPRTAEDIASWLEEDLPLVVVESDGEVVAWAVAHRYRDRAAYAGVGEFSVYVARDERGRGHGRAAVQGLIDECERRGLWKLVSRVFPENEASLALCRSLGFREVGVYRRHAQLDGEWRDVVIVERLLEWSSASRHSLRGNTAKTSPRAGSRPSTSRTACARDLRAGSPGCRSTSPSTRQSSPRCCSSTTYPPRLWLINPTTPFAPRSRR